MTRFDGTHISAEAWDELFPTRPQSIAASLVVRPPVQVRPMTVVVVGAFRGGTSFVGEQLVALGVPMGELYVAVEPSPDYVSYEDDEIGPAIDKQNWTALASLVKARNARHELWGFKKPSSAFWIDTILAILRNPHVIAIIRDPLACHQSGRAHGTVRDGDLSIKNCRSHFSAVMDVVEKPRCPTLAISYERAKDKKSATQQAIREFLGL